MDTPSEIEEQHYMEDQYARHFCEQMNKYFGVSLTPFTAEYVEYEHKYGQILEALETASTSESYRGEA